VFRWASIGAAACLLGMWANSGAKQLASSSPPLPPPALGAAPSPVPAPPAAMPLPSSSAEPPRIAPGRSLNGAVITPGAPEVDRFGTLQPRR